MYGGLQPQQYTQQKGGQAAKSNHHAQAPHQNPPRPSNPLPWTTGSRVYVTRKEEVEDAPNMTPDTFYIKTHPIKVLFDSGVTHSFVPTKLVKALGFTSTSKLSLLPIALLHGKTVRCEVLFMDYPI